MYSQSASPFAGSACNQRNNGLTYNATGNNTYRSVQFLLEQHCQDPPDWQLSLQTVHLTAKSSGLVAMLTAQPNPATLKLQETIQLPCNNLLLGALLHTTECFHVLQHVPWSMYYTS